MAREFTSEVHRTSPPTELSDYDFLRATYEALLRARQPDVHAINAAFDALDAAHERLRAAHEARKSFAVTHRQREAVH